MGRSIREMRREAGLSQAELGDRAGVSGDYVGNVERGDYTPAPDTIQALREELRKALGEDVPEEDRLTAGQRRRIADRKGRARDE